VRDINKEWSALCKEMQLQLKKPESYQQGLESLYSLREELTAVLLSFRDELPEEDFCAMPYQNAVGYHSKTVAYSIWHIFRIEDIAAHTLIEGDQQVFFSGNYRERIRSPLITTGNELEKQQIADFSEQLKLDELYSYSAEVRKSTEDILRKTDFGRLKEKVSPERREALLSLKVVSEDEKAAWLVDYWCSKDVRGLIQMPFSRHWIMHTEACLRIRDGLRKQKNR